MKKTLALLSLCISASVFAQPQTSYVGSYVVNSTNYHIYRYWGVDTNAAQQKITQQPWYFGNSTPVDYPALLQSSQFALAVSLSGSLGVHEANFGRFAIARDPAYVNDGITGQNWVLTPALGVNGVGTYAGAQVAMNDADFINGLQYWLVLGAPLGPNPVDTYLSTLTNALALRSAFDYQSAKIVQGLSYDCTVYDPKKICVSLAGAITDAKGGFDASTSTVLIAGYKPSNHFRLGGYLDRSYSTSSSGGLTISKGRPGVGVFGAWTQNADGSGVELRASFNTGKAGVQSVRTAVESAEAGTGKTDITSSGFQIEISRDYALNPRWSARPHLSYRRTTHTRAGYTEQLSDTVTAPLTYQGLKQSTETMAAGVTFSHAMSAQTRLSLTAGAEHELNHRVDNYQAANADIGAIDPVDMRFNSRKIRPTVSLALNHTIDSTQRIGVSVTHRNGAFESGSSTSAFIQYTKGF